MLCKQGMEQEDAPNSERQEIDLAMETLLGLRVLDHVLLLVGAMTEPMAKVGFPNSLQLPLENRGPQLQSSARTLLDLEEVFELLLDHVDSASSGGTP